VVQSVHVGAGGQVDCAQDVVPHGVEMGGDDGAALGQDCVEFVDGRANERFVPGSETLLERVVLLGVFVDPCHAL
jgi:hypothetical protein